MDGAWLHRMRWRRRGAWLWPAYAATLVIDAIAGHAWPPAGETQTVPAALLAGCLLNLIAILLLSRPLGAVLRRYRPDLPRIVARDYGGTIGVLVATAALLVAGLAHQSTITGHQRAMADAITRAQAFIGARAPAAFRRNIEYVDTVPIEDGRIYRTCVPSVDRRRTYCVIVKEYLPFERSVAFSGYEPNQIFAAGTQ